MFGSKSALHRRFQEWIAEGIFDKIEKEALKLYERSVKIKTKRMVADGNFARGGFHWSKPDGSRQKRYILVDRRGAL